MTAAAATDTHGFPLMAVESVISNPIGWSQVRLVGGGRKVLMICGVWAGLVLFVNVLIYRGIAAAEHISLGAFADGSLAVMLVIQAGLVFLVGTSAIKKAIHRDFTTEMITSHRTTAMTGRSAVLGYLTGPTVTVLALTAVNWVACTILSVLAESSPLGPTVLFSILGCLALMTWMLAVLVGLSTRGTMSIVGVLIVVAIATGAQEVFRVLPGMALLVSYTSVSGLRTGMAISGIDASILMALFVSLLAQVVLAVIFFEAAARKYARDDVIAFTPALAYALLAACTLVCTLALVYWPDPAMRGFAPTIDPGIQVIATLCSLVLVAILPVATAARRSALWATRKAKDSDFDGRKPRPFVEAPIISTLLVFGILAALHSNREALVFPGYELPSVKATAHVVLPVAEIAAYALCAFLLALVPIGGLLRYVYATVPKAGWYLFFYVILFWAVPPLLDLGSEAIRAPMIGASRTWLFGCSPVGTWILACTDVQGPIVPGLIVQALIGAGFLLVARKAKY